MKMPWDFLAGLRSRKATVEVHSNSIIDDADIDALVSDAEKTASLSSRSTDTNGLASDDGRAPVLLPLGEMENEPGVCEKPTLSTSEHVSDDVEILDIEIRQLKASLAQKIRLQNAQLEKMLERFEVR
jgi:hypothetical protein